PHIRVVDLAFVPLGVGLEKAELRNTRRVFIVGESGKSRREYKFFVRPIETVSDLLRIYKENLVDEFPERGTVKLVEINDGRLGLQSLSGATIRGLPAILGEPGDDVSLRLSRVAGETRDLMVEIRPIHAPVTEPPHAVRRLIFPGDGSVSIANARGANDLHNERALEVEAGIVHRDLTGDLANVSPWLMREKVRIFSQRGAPVIMAWLDQDTTMEEIARRLENPERRNVLSLDQVDPQTRAQKQKIFNRYLASYRPIPELVQTRLNPWEIYARVKYVFEVHGVPFHAAYWNRLARFSSQALLEQMPYLKFLDLILRLYGLQERSDRVLLIQEGYSTFVRAGARTSLGPFVSALDEFLGREIVVPLEALLSFRWKRDWLADMRDLIGTHTTGDQEEPLAQQWRALLEIYRFYLEDQEQHSEETKRRLQSLQEEGLRSAVVKEVSGFLALLDEIENGSQWMAKELGQVDRPLFVAKIDLFDIMEGREVERLISDLTDIGMDPQEARETLRERQEDELKALGIDLARRGKGAFVSYEEILEVVDGLLIDTIDILRLALGILGHNGFQFVWRPAQDGRAAGIVVNDFPYPFEVLAQESVQQEEVGSLRREIARLMSRNSLEEWSIQIAEKIAQLRSAGDLFDNFEWKRMRIRWGVRYGDLLRSMGIANFKTLQTLGFVNGDGGRLRLPSTRETAQAILRWLGLGRFIDTKFGRVFVFIFTLPWEIISSLRSNFLDRHDPQTEEQRSARAAGIRGILFWTQMGAMAGALVGVLVALSGGLVAFAVGLFVGALVGGILGNMSRHGVHNIIHQDAPLSIGEQQTVDLNVFDQDRLVNVEALGTRIYIDRQSLGKKYPVNRKAGILPILRITHGETGYEVVLIDGQQNRTTVPYLRIFVGAKTLGLVVAEGISPSLMDQEILYDLQEAGAMDVQVELVGMKEPKRIHLGLPYQPSAGLQGRHLYYQLTYTEQGYRVVGAHTADEGHFVEERYPLVRLINDGAPEERIAWSQGLEGDDRNLWVKKIQDHPYAVMENVLVHGADAREKRIATVRDVKLDWLYSIPAELEGRYVRILMHYGIPVLMEVLPSIEDTQSHRIPMVRVIQGRRIRASSSTGALQLSKLPGEGTILSHLAGYEMRGKTIYARPSLEIGQPLEVSEGKVRAAPAGAYVLEARYEGFPQGPPQIEKKTRPIRVMKDLVKEPKAAKPQRESPPREEPKPNRRERPESRRETNPKANPKVKSESEVMMITPRPPVIVALNVMGSRLVMGAVDLRGTIHPESYHQESLSAEAQSDSTLFVGALSEALMVAHEEEWNLGRQVQHMVVTVDGIVNQQGVVFTDSLHLPAAQFDLLSPLRRQLVRRGMRLPLTIGSNDTAFGTVEGYRLRVSRYVPRRTDAPTAILHFSDRLRGVVFDYRQLRDPLDGISETEARSLRRFFQRTRTPSDAAEEIHDTPIEAKIRQRLIQNGEFGLLPGVDSRIPEKTLQQLLSGPLSESAAAEYLSEAVIKIAESTGIRKFYITGPALSAGLPRALNNGLQKKLAQTTSKDVDVNVEYQEERVAYGLLGAAQMASFVEENEQPRSVIPTHRLEFRPNENRVEVGGLNVYLDKRSVQNQLGLQERIDLVMMAMEKEHYRLWIMSKGEKQFLPLIPVWNEERILALVVGRIMAPSIFAALSEDLRQRGIQEFTVGPLGPIAAEGKGLLLGSYYRPGESFHNHYVFYTFGLTSQGYVPVRLRTADQILGEEQKNVLVRRVGENSFLEVAAFAGQSQRDLMRAVLGESAEAMLENLHVGVIGEIRDLDMNILLRLSKNHVDRDVDVLYLNGVPAAVRMHPALLDPRETWMPLARVRRKDGPYVDFVHQRISRASLAALGHVIVENVGEDYSLTPKLLEVSSSFEQGYQLEFADGNLVQVTDAKGRVIPLAELTERKNGQLAENLEAHRRYLENGGEEPASFSVPLAQPSIRLSVQRAGTPGSTTFSKKILSSEGRVRLRVFSVGPLRVWRIENPEAAEYGLDLVYFEG
ncbi:MAG: hypothetical protein NUV91_05055, partial [Candidatus Omnitrophica bacterium]|nr:hypothetical protein [Candidatus Omnitrophota bacterium]